MESNEIQTVSNESGETTAVIVPIAVWRDIQSELETAHLLNFAEMRQPLIEASQRTDGIPFEAALEKLGI